MSDFQPNLAAPQHERARSRPHGAWLISILETYKRFLSPWFPPSCRFVPTCSEYAIDAIAYYGVARGSLMACWRVLRCHPFAKGGCDPAYVHNSSATISHDTISEQSLSQ